MTLAEPDLAGGRPGPSGVFRISERDWLSSCGVLGIEGFGGRPPVGGRLGARGPPAPPKSGPGLWTTLNAKIEIFMYFLATSGCETHFKREMR